MLTLAGGVADFGAVNFQFPAKAKGMINSLQVALTPAKLYYQQVKEDLR